MDCLVSLGDDLCINSWFGVYETGNGHENRCSKSGTDVERVAVNSNPRVSPFM